jgi:hypothetical protein
MSGTILQVYDKHQQDKIAEAPDMARVEFERMDSAQRMDIINGDMKRFVEDGTISRAQLPKFQETMHFLKGAEEGEAFESEMFGRIKEVPQGGPDAIDTIVEEIRKAKLEGAPVDPSSPYYRGLLDAADRAENNFRSAGNRAILSYQEKEGDRLMDNQLNTSLNSIATAHTPEALGEAKRQFTDTMTVFSQTHPNKDVTANFLPVAESMIKNLIATDQFDEADTLMETLKEHKLGDGGTFGKVGTVASSFNILEGRLAQAQAVAPLKAAQQRAQEKDSGQAMAGEFLAQKSLDQREDGELASYVEEQRELMKSGDITSTQFRAIESTVNRELDDNLRRDAANLDSEEALTTMEGVFADKTDQEIMAHDELSYQKRVWFKDRKNVKLSIVGHTQALTPDNLMSAVLKKRNVTQGDTVQTIISPVGSIGAPPEALTILQDLSAEGRTEELFGLGSQFAEGLQADIVKAYQVEAIDAKARGEKLDPIKMNKIRADTTKEHTEQFYAGLISTEQTRVATVKAEAEAVQARYTAISTASKRKTIPAMDAANDEDGASRINSGGNRIVVSDVLQTPTKAREVLQRLGEATQVSPETIHPTADVAYYEMKGLVGYLDSELASGTTEEGVTFNPSQVDPRISPIFLSLVELNSTRNADGTYKPEFYERIHKVNHEVFENEDEAFNAQLKLYTENPYLLEIYKPQKKSQPNADNET